MLRIEHRQMYRPNGLIDDLVIYGTPRDYIAFAEQVQTAIGGDDPVTFKTASQFQIEIVEATEGNELFTFLQNADDIYGSTEDWAKRTILRVCGNSHVLDRLRCFLIDLSGRGEGYSYISEYSTDSSYSTESPQWRLHVQLP